jgi:hypothetical protein
MHNGIATAKNGDSYANIEECLFQSCQSALLEIESELSPSSQSGYRTALRPRGLNSSRLVVPPYSFLL